MKTGKLLLVSLLLSWSALMCCAQQVSFRNFSVDDGLAQSQVYCLVQDHKGYLWLGTRGGGLSRFDGRNFQTYTETNGISSNYISALFQDSKKNLLVGTNNGLTVYNGTRFVRIKSPGSQNGFVVNAFSSDGEGKVWVASNRGIYSFEGNQLKKQNQLLKLDNQSVNSLVFKDSDLWFGTNSGLYQVQHYRSNPKVIFHGKANKVMQNAITCVRLDQKGNLWIGTYGDGAYSYNGRKFFRIDLRHELYRTTVFDVFPDDDGTIWFATLSAGLVNYNGNTKAFKAFNQTDGLSNNHVRAILKDRWGDFWLGTSGGGISQLAGKRFSHFTTTAGLGGSFVYSVYRDSRNRLWMGTGQNGVSVFENGSFRQYNKTNGFDAIKVKAITEGENGRLFFGTEGQGIGMLSGETFSWMKRTKGFFIKQLARGGDGIIWSATAGNGLLRIQADGSSFEEILVKRGCIENRLTCVFVDSKGMVWYGSESKGVGCYNPQTKKHRYFNEEKGLVSNAIRCITEDKQGRIWVGTAGSGLNAISPESGKVIETVGLKDGLTSANSYLMVCNDVGNLMVGSESGLDQLTFSSGLKVTRAIHYGRGEGFLGVETCQNSVWKDVDGRIWFGTINGLTAYNPKTKQRNTCPPVLSINDVQLFYESLGKAGYAANIGPWRTFKEISLPYDQNHLSFLFKGIDLRNPEGVEYSWKMKGFDERWSPWTKEQRIVYSNMPSGTFTFLVRARNEDGVYSEKPVSFEIVVATPFWRTPWFIFLEIIAGILVVWLLTKAQTARIRKKAFAAQEKAEMELNLMELEQKALRLQMNPHFIFNALNSIQSLIGTENETKARYFLAKFSRLMRQILDNSGKATISLEEEIATLENYLLIEQFCTGSKFEYDITTELRTEADYIQLPPMLVQPFVENAIKHGFRFTADDKRNGIITISFVEEQNGIRCIIRDNGIGREASAKLKAVSTDGTHESKGLSVTQERLELLGEKRSVHIIDLYENGKSSGTEVQLFIPF